MAKRPVVLIHGYSAQGKDFEKWRELLPADTYHVHVGDYISLNNELTIKDIAEGFDRALEHAFKTDPKQSFDAIVHSTGMLVIRCWLTVFPQRASRLKHLIGLAPATNGSPLAHKGRGLLGAIFKGNKVIGPDFLEAGDQILNALELGSEFIWNLSHQDLFGSRAFYGPDASTPYVFVFCGLQGYDGLRELINKPGTDGTVRWSGASLNSRKISIDLTAPHANERAQLVANPNVDHIPLVLVDGVNHTSIVSKPPDGLVKLVLSALQVNDNDSYMKWCDDAKRLSATPKAQFQQFVVRLVDERGDPIPDYHVQCFGANSDELADWEPLRQFEADVHSFQKDPSYRNFHVELDTTLLSLERVGVRLTASSGTQLIQYQGFGDGIGKRLGTTPMAATQVDLSFPTKLVFDKTGKPVHAQFFHPNTTTFIEIKMNREPTTIAEENKVFALRVS